MNRSLRWKGAAITLLTRGRFKVVGTVAAAISLLPLAAQAGCTCGFTADQRGRADEELWLNKRDQAASLERHLPWGVPKVNPDGYPEKLLVQRDYVIGYSADLALPVWTAHRLSKKSIEAREKAKQAAADKDRKNCFRPDPRLTNRERAICANYEEPVFDQGHLVPDADMPAKPVSSLINSYIFSNIAPQYCHFNRGVWLFLEGLVREWAREKDEVQVISGAIFDRDHDGKPDAPREADRLKANKFGAAPAVPTHFYKVVLHRTEAGELEAMAILLPHDNKIVGRQEARAYLKRHLTTIDAIEKAAGVNLPPSISGARSSPEEALERFLAPALWETGGGLPPTFDAGCKD